MRVLALLGLLTGCGGEGIRSYRVAVDPSPLAALPGSCYRGGTVPSPRVEERNLFRDLRWTEWEGQEDRVFLEVDGPAAGWALGDAPVIRLDGAIAGTEDTFSAERVTADASGNMLERVALRVEFEERGTVSRGTVHLFSNCASCAGGSTLSCAARLSFTAREEPLPE